MQASKSDEPVPINGATAERRVIMGLLARASREELSSGLAALAAASPFDEVRPPEIGAVMLRGRIGGDGAPFNIGEATVTRCAVRLGTGETGSSYVLGRHPDKARLAALVDALWQRCELKAGIEEHLIRPIRRRLEEDARRRAAETAATRVEFFTVVRGED
jgi:alpha-D-ribose 1-methylphosphonate 5-triphosphate synthase subunit PhnG